MPKADETVTAARYQQLNEQFYAAEPSEYFRTRLLTLLLLAGRTDDLLGLLREGVEHAGVTAKVDADAEIDAASMARYVAVESQVLLHSAAEALIRLLLAHAGSPPCPWFEVSSETSFRRFKKRVEDEVISPRRRGTFEEQVAVVLLGRRQPGPDDDPKRWKEATENLASFVRVLAERWLKDARLYNAMKHGLAVVPGDAVFQVLDDDDKAIRLGEGTSVEYLESTPWENDRRQWQTTTRWLDVRESLGLVEVACLMIDSLWLVAKYRYLRVGGEDRLFFPAGLKPADLRGPRSLVQAFSWRLLEERRRQ